MAKVLEDVVCGVFTEWVKDIPDPRLVQMITYPLTEILFVLFVGQLCGMNDVDETVVFAKMQMEWLHGFFLFENGIAPAQTIRRILSVLDHKVFEALFTAWASQWGGSGVIAIDGKCLKGASKKDAGYDALYTVSAFASRSGMVLGQCKVHDKSNEITAIPVLLEQLTIKGNIVTIDAMGTQSAIAEIIRAKDGHYILALKGNQGSLHDDVKCFFEDKVLSAACLSHKTLDLGHGRIEERFIRVIDARDWLCAMHPQWKDLHSIIEITSVRTQKKTGHTTTEVRYYITSLLPEPETLMKAIRAHWGIENTLHWSLDVTFGEDKSRLRQKNAAANMSIIRKAAFNALKQDTSDFSLKLKRVKAAHDQAFRSSLIKRS